MSSLVLLYVRMACGTTLPDGGSFASLNNAREKVSRLMWERSVIVRHG